MTRNEVQLMEEKLSEAHELFKRLDELQAWANHDEVCNVNLTVKLTFTGHTGEFYTLHFHQEKTMPLVERLIGEEIAALKLQIHNL